MSAACFVDTNLLVYARDASEPAKQPRAWVWLEVLWQRRCGRLSWQVLQEYYVVVTQRLRPGMPMAVAREDVETLLAWRPVGMDDEVLRLGWAVQDRFGFSFWDALIVAAAQRARCRYLLTEDLQHGQRLPGGLTVVDPFRTAPAELLA